MTNDKITKEAKAILKVARQFSSTCEKAGGDISPAHILDMSMEDFLVLCAHNNLKLIYINPNVALFDKEIKFSYRAVDDIYYARNNNQFLGVGKSNTGGEVHYFVEID